MSRHHAGAAVWQQDLSAEIEFSPRQDPPAHRYWFRRESNRRFTARDGLSNLSGGNHL